MEKMQADFEYVWKVENPFLLNPHTITVVETPEFEMPTVPPTKWKLGYSNKDIRERNYVRISIKRSSNDDGPAVVFLRFKLSIRGSTLDTHSNCNGISAQFRKGDSVKRYIQNDNKKLITCAENNLLIKWEVLITHDGKFIKIGDKKDIEILSQDMKNLFESEILTDIVLKTRDQKVKLHKSVLWARAPNLLKLVDPEEKPKDPQITQDALKTLLLYIYSGYLANDDTCIPLDIFTAVQMDNTANLRRSMRDVPSKFDVHSRVNKFSTSYEFSIKNFFEWDSNEKILSPLLNIGVSQLSQCRLVAQVSPKAGNYSSVELLLCIQCIFAETPDPIHMSYKIMASLANRKQNFSSHCSISDGEQCKLPFIFDLGISTSHDNMKRYPYPLSFKIILTTSDGTLSHSQCTKYLGYLGPLSKIKFLRLDLSKLLMNTEFSDVNLVVGEREFPAHKAILAARSPVFCRMFQTDMVENRTHKVTIVNVKPDIVAWLLEYIYTSEIQLRNNLLVTELYAIADKYEVLALKQTCASYLKSHLNEEIVREVLIVADMHFDEELKNVAEKFMHDFGITYE